MPNLVDQIQKRGREYEDNIRLDYLKQLNSYYNNWIENYREGELLVIDVDTLNFADNPDDFSTVVQKIDSQLFGLF
ncbi:MAG: deoxynucleoside kinase [Chitinophagales bacterium]